MLRQVLICIAIGLLLAGCVLQSPQPLLVENQGLAFLQPYGTRFAPETFSIDRWKRGDGVMTFTPVGKHYVFSNDKDDKTSEALFADLGNGFALVQLSDQQDPATYLIAQASKDGILLFPLMCNELKKNSGGEGVVTFKDSNCVLNKVPDAATVKAWVAAIGPAKIRAVPAK